RTAFLECNWLCLIKQDISFLRIRPKPHTRLSWNFCHPRVSAQNKRRLELSDLAIHPIEIGGLISLQQTLYQVANGVATITLNRPDKLNVWTAIMEQEVRSCLEEAEHDDKVRLVVLTGAGRGFCAGADISLLSSVATKGAVDGERVTASRLAGNRLQREG